MFIHERFVHAWAIRASTLIMDVTILKITILNDITSQFIFVDGACVGDPIWRIFYTYIKAVHVT